MNDDQRRIVDITPWVPWAYVNDSGQAVTRDMLPMLLVHVVIPAREIILRAMATAARDDRA